MRMIWRFGHKNLWSRTVPSRGTRVACGATGIRAPYDGIVKDLAVQTLGAVVQAGSPLLQVVPKGEVLRPEA